MKISYYDALSVLMRPIALIAIFCISTSDVTGQGNPTPCPVTAIVNPNGTITLQAPGLTVLNECYDAANTSFVNTLYHVKCTNIVKEYVLMVSDAGRVYHFDLPYQNSSYFGQWCGQSNHAVWYHQIKYDPNWRHDGYMSQCQHVRSTGRLCSRLSELDKCWQHR